MPLGGRTAKLHAAINVVSERQDEGYLGVFPESKLTYDEHSHVICLFFVALFTRSKVATRVSPFTSTCFVETLATP